MTIRRRPERLSSRRKTEPLTALPPSQQSKARETEGDAATAILSSLQYLITEAQTAGLSRLARALSRVIMARENWSKSEK